MGKLRKAFLSTMLAGVVAMGMYGCGDAPAATPTTVAPTATTAAEPEDTAEPTAVVEPTTVVAQPTATTAAVVEATATTATTGGTGAPGDVKALFAQAEAAMKGVKSYHLSTRSETAGTVTTSEGDIEPPDKARIVADAGAAGKSEIIMIGKESFMKLSGSESYMALPQSPLAHGDAASFVKYAEDAKVVGDETIDGVATTHVQFVYDLDRSAADTAAQTGQPAPTMKMGKAQADMYIEKSTGYIRQFKYVTNIEGVGSSTITTTYSKFNEPITTPIEKPTNITSTP